MVTVEDPQSQISAFHFEKQAVANDLPNAQKESFGVGVVEKLSRNTLCVAGENPKRTALVME